VQVLPPHLQNELNGGRQLLAQLRDALTRFGASSEDQAALASSIRQLDEFFMLVVVGEFNAGKSAFINALVGRQVLKEGVTPTTAQIHVLKYGDTVTHSADEQGLTVSTAPSDVLREVQIVDTPGTNAIIREHERITQSFVPRADLVLFVTSADRPFTETERAFLETIRGWGKKIVVVVNKADIFERPEELEEVLAFVRSASHQLLGMTPELFAVSARLALRAKQGEPAVWTASRFEPLERYIAETLDEGSRFRLKLANPIGVGEALAQRYAAIAHERLTLLDADLSLLANVDQQLTLSRSDLARGFELRMTAVEKVLVEMEARGHAYFEDTLRIGRVMDLFNRSRIQKEFEERVVSDAPRQIERAVTELIDWLIDQEFRQWQAVTTAIGARTKEHQSGMLGAPDVGSFHSDRSRLIDAVGREAQRVVDTYDRKREAAVIADHARTAVTTAAAGRRRCAGAGHARHACRVDRRRRRHRNPAGQCRGHARLPGHSRPPPQGQGRDERQDVRAPRPPRPGAPLGIRARADPKPAAHRRCGRAVQPFRPLRTGALDVSARRPRGAARPGRIVPPAARGVGSAVLSVLRGHPIVPLVVFVAHPLVPFVIFVAESL
jgi:small GTP-binding protein